jgi:hypothetical protein
MARLLLSLAALAALAPFTHAGIIFTKPEAGAVLTAGTAIEVEWKEGGDGPALADLLSYQLFLSAGGPTKQVSTNSLYSHAQHMRLSAESLDEDVG